MHVDVAAPVAGPRSAPPHTAPKAWNIALWVVQVLLAVSFGMAGWMKATQPIAELAEKMVWPGAVPAALVRFIGVTELAAAIGLILPAATRIKPVLTPLAAIGLVVVMVFAAIFHVARGEFGALPINFVYGALAALVAWGRLRKAPIAPR
ncbi:MAG TPA: DoxX family protein [Polyangiaceae bacterium]